jgi:hypothetical protein
VPPGKTLRPIPDLETFVATRDALHVLAEHVLAPARHRATGRIGLRATEGGFGTPPFGDAGEVVRVAGTDLVIERAGDERVVPITTIGAAAGAVGITPGAPTEVYTPDTPLEPDRPLPIDDRAADVLARWYAFGTRALEDLRAEADAADTASEVQLWPEHFDLGLDLGDESRGARATFGASPGDRYHAQPYLYVQPWNKGLPPDDFWNDTTFTGASLQYEDLLAANDQMALAGDFLRRGRAVLRANASVGS